LCELSGLGMDETLPEIASAVKKTEGGKTRWY